MKKEDEIWAKIDKEINKLEKTLKVVDLMIDGLEEIEKCSRKGNYERALAFAVAILEHPEVRKLNKKKRRSFSVPTFMQKKGKLGDEG